MTDTSLEADFLDRLYGVAMEPERFEELIGVWQVRIDQAIGEGRLASEEDLHHLNSHLARAGRLLDLVTEQDRLFPQPLLEKIEAEPHAIVAIDKNARIAARNSAAIKLYGEDGSDGLDSLPFDGETLGFIRNRCVDLAKGGHDEKPVLLRGFHRLEGRPTLLSISTWQTGGGRSLLLLRSLDFTWNERLSTIIRDVFALTEAETSVMQLLAEGNTPGSIAEIRGASLATVRTQIRSLYDKTGTRNQGEFLRMALGLGSLEVLERNQLTGAFEGPMGEAFKSHPLPEERALLTLPSGRIMDYADFGARDGRVCLFLHNEFFGDIWPAAGVREAERLGLRIVAPARPCFGRSTCLDSGPVPPEETADDYAFLLDHLGIDQVVAMFHMSGGISALAFAERHPDRTRALAPIAPMFPMALPGEEGRLVKFHKFLSNLMHRHKGMLEFVARAGYSYHDRVGTKRFLAMLSKDRAPDREMLENDRILADITEGIRFSGTCRHRAFHDDYFYPPDNAWERFMALDMPLVFLLGDEVDVARNRSVAELLERHPRAEALTAKGGAHYVQFTHPEEMAKAVDLAWRAD